MRQECAEQRRPLARAVGQNLRHKTTVIIVEDRLRHGAEESEGVDMAVDPGLGNRRRIRPDIAGVAVRQIEGEEVRLLLHPADHHHRLAEIRLCLTRRMGQRYEHLLVPAFVLAHIILDDRVAAGEPVLFAQAVEDPLGRVALLAGRRTIPFQPAVDDCDEPVQLRAPDRRLTPVPRRGRIGQHLGNAVPRDVEMLRSRPLAHPFRASQPYLQVKFHGIDPSTLPALYRKDVGGRLLRRPKRDNPAATVAEFCTAAYSYR